MNWSGRLTQKPACFIFVESFLHHHHQRGAATNEQKKTNERTCKVEREIERETIVWKKVNGLESVYDGSVCNRT